MREQFLLHSDGTNGHEVLRLVQFGPGQERLGPCGFNRGVDEVQFVGDAVDRVREAHRLGLELVIELPARPALIFHCG